MPKKQQQPLNIIDLGEEVTPEQAEWFQRGWTKATEEYVPIPKTLAAKLAEVSALIGRIPKNGYNNFHKYNYVLEADLVDHIRPLLAERNIIVLPRVARTQSREFEQTVEGWALDREEELTSIVYEYDIIDGDTRETLTTSAVGYGSDKGDKGAYKASTGAYKYMLMRLFQVATGDDPEGDERTDQRTGAGGGSVRIGASNVQAERGGHTRMANAAQINEVKNHSRRLALGPEGMGMLIKKVLSDELTLPEDRHEAATQLTRYLEGLTSQRIGTLIEALETTKSENDDAEPAYP